MDDPQPDDQIFTHIGDNAQHVTVGKAITHIEAQNVYLQTPPPVDDEPVVG